MADAIFVRKGVIVPGDAIEMRASRSSGPGGQNVNKIASKVELRVDLERVQGIDPEGRRRLHSLVRRRLDSDGHLLVTSQLTRNQFRNLEDAREKVRKWILKAIDPPRKRIPTLPGRGSQERRLSEKHRNAETKALRRPVRQEDT